MTAAPTLGEWIAPEHLTAAARGAGRAAFGRDRFSSLVIDGFLRPAPLAGLRCCFAGDARFAPHYGLIDPPARAGASFGEREVAQAAFAAAPDAERLAREWVMAGPAAGRRASRGWQAQLGWTRLLSSPTFADYLTALTGIGGLDAMRYMPRIMRRGDFCRAHDDTDGRRRLCMLFYLDDGWRPGFGGRFQHLADDAVARSVEPIGNRVLLHAPRLDRIHQVEAFAPAAAQWARWTYSIWFGAAPDRSGASAA